MILDAVILASWIVLATEVFRLVRVPRWAQYLLLFTGVVAYERVTRTWEGPGGVDG